MRQRQTRRLTDRATIERREKTGENAIGEPQHGTVVVAEDVPCRFDDRSTSFVREDTGERTQRPASAAFDHAVDIQEGDTVTIDDADATFEVRGVETTRDHRRSTVIAVEAELERVD